MPQVEQTFSQMIDSFFGSETPNLKRLKEIPLNHLISSLRSFRTGRRFCCLHDYIHFYKNKPEHFQMLLKHLENIGKEYTLFYNDFFELFEISDLHLQTTLHYLLKYQHSSVNVQWISFFGRLLDQGACPDRILVVLNKKGFALDTIWDHLFECQPIETVEASAELILKLLNKSADVRSLMHSVMSALFVRAILSSVDFLELFLKKLMVDQDEKTVDLIIEVFRYVLNTYRKKNTIQGPEGPYLTFKKSKLSISILKIFVERLLPTPYADKISEDVFMLSDGCQMISNVLNKEINRCHKQRIPYQFLLAERQYYQDNASQYFNIGQNLINERKKRKVEAPPVFPFFSSPTSSPTSSFSLTNSELPATFGFSPMASD